MNLLTLALSKFLMLAHKEKQLTYLRIDYDLKPNSAGVFFERK